MKKLRFNTGADAVYRSAQAAEALGAGMTFGSTQLRWTVLKDETGYYLEIPSEDEKLLTEEEVQSLFE